jgi:hypothetical protein
MPKQNNAQLTFNRGLISKRGLARIDLPRTAISAEVMTNWIARTLGSMSIRPGWEYIASTRSNAAARAFPFIFSADDTARLEISEGTLRVFVDDDLITRPAVTATVTNGAFTSDIASWTDSDESGAASTWLTGGYAALLGTGTNAAILDQQITVNEANTLHTLRIVVQRGPIILRVGSTSGGDDYISETTLGTGTHSLTLTPTGDFHIRVMNRRLFTALLDSVIIESSGTLEIDVPWLAADLAKIRMTQSGDVIYVACDGYQQRKIERRDNDSWSVVLYEPETGPFRNVNTTPITLTPSALTGDVTLTASKALFRSTHVGALFRIQSTGQTVTATITAEDTFTSHIRVAGVGGTRIFSILLTGIFTATVTLQQSIGEPGNWVDVTSYSTEESTSYNDELDNQIIYYRIGVKAGGFTSGSIAATLIYSSGSIVGVAKVTGYTSSTVVNAIVLAAFGAITASSDWWEGSWSDRRGWPSAVALFESRLWWAGKDNIYGSISDQYEDFDDEFEGDAGPINRSIGEGPVETITWILPLSRLLLGTLSNSAPIAAIKIDGNNVLSGRSSSFDEPLTPTNFNLKTASATGIFVQRSGQKLLSLSFDINESDYKHENLSVAVPDLNEAGIAGIAVQYQPDIRVHCWRNDGTVGLMTMDKAENLICWTEIETDGEVEDVSVLPGDEEDQVYYIVKRTIDGATVRFHEKWAKESECRGRPQGRLADAHYMYSGAATTTITGLSHLEGEEVIVWGWNTATPFTAALPDGTTVTVGRDFGTFTVSGGQITGLSAAVTNACVGLGYTATYKSAKQAFAAAMGTALNQSKRIDHLGLILIDTHAKGLEYGQDFATLDELPDVEDHFEVDSNTVHEAYDKDMIEFDGDWDTDSRFCLQAQAPRPATVLCVTVSMTTSG